MQINNPDTQPKTAPRVTSSDVQDCISSVHYFTAGQGVLGSGQTEQFCSPLLLLTFCVLVLKNGFTVTGESACVSPDNFDPVGGQGIARKNAEKKIWTLLAYELKTELARPVLTEEDADADLAGTARPVK